MSIQIRANEAVQMSVSATDSEGNPATPGGLTWSLSDSSLGSLVEDTTDSTYWFVTSGRLGTATVTVSDDEDGDPSTAEFIGSLAIDITPGPVAAIDISAGTPVPRDEAPEAPEPIPPVEEPPVDVPPVDVPPVEEPPVETPPVDVPPVEEPTPDPEPAPPVEEPTPSEPVLAPQAVYTHADDGVTPIDPTQFTEAPFTTESGEKLYFYAGDTPGSAGTADSGSGFTPYTGSLVAQAAPEPAPSDVPQPDAPTV